MSLPPFNQTAAGGTVPTGYVRGMAPLEATGYPVYVAAELEKLERTIATLQELVPQSATKAPTRPLEGMIRLSKAPWRPVAGQASDRWVTYVGGAWVYLNSI